MKYKLDVVCSYDDVWAAIEFNKVGDENKNTSWNKTEKDICIKYECINDSKIKCGLEALKNLDSEIVECYDNLEKISSKLKVLEKIKENIFRQIVKYKLEE